MTGHLPALTDGAVDFNRHIGTELRGINLLALSDEGLEALRELVARRGVVVFRDQAMTVRQQIEFASRFGPLHAHPLYAAGQSPEVLRIHTDASSRYAFGDDWHSDLSWSARPPSLAVLRMEVNPSSGGDTLFASTYAAYEGLSDPLKAFLLGRSAVHEYGQANGRRRLAVHPVVRRHPISERLALFVNASYTTSIEGLTAAESASILSMLTGQIAERVDRQCRVRWAADTVVIWDNRCTQHCASWDYHPETRTAWRVTIQGEVPSTHPAPA